MISRRIHRLAPAIPWVVLPLLCLLAALPATARDTVPTPPGGGAPNPPNARDDALPGSAIAPPFVPPQPQQPPRLPAGAEKALLAALPTAGGDDVNFVTMENVYNLSLDIAENGDIYAVVQVNDPVSGRGLTVYRSQDGGDSFSQWGTISDPAASNTFSEPHLIVAEGIDDRVYVVYQRYTGAGTLNSIRMKYADLSGATAAWSPEITVMEAVNTAFYAPRIATDSDSYDLFYLYVVAEGENEGSDIWFARSINQGVSFEAAYQIGSLSTSDRDYLEPDICWGYGGQVHVTWHFTSREHLFDGAIRYRSATNNASGGISAWGAYGYLTPTSDGDYDMSPRIAASQSSNEVVIGYRRLEYTPDPGYYTVRPLAVLASTDAGTAWGGEVVLPSVFYTVDELMHQPATNEFILAGHLANIGYYHANAADLTDWSGVELLADTAYPSAYAYDMGAALDPSHGDRVGLVWPNIGYVGDPSPIYFDADWRGDPGYPNFEPGFPLDLSAGPLSAPAVVDVDGDGDLEIVFSDAAHRIQVLHHNGAPLAGWPVAVGEALSNGPVAIGDLNGDGAVSLLVGTLGGKVFGYAPDGNLLRGFPRVTPVAEPAYVSIGALGGPYARTAVVCVGNRLEFLNYRGVAPLGTHGWGFGTRTIDHPAAIGDVDDDGVAEAVLVADDLVFAVPLYATESTFTRILSALASGPPSLGDFDLNGDVEVAVPCADGSVALLDGDGTYWPGWPVTTASGTPASAVAIANLLGLPAPELSFAARNYTVELFFETGNRCSGWPRSTGTGWYVYAAPIIGLVDGSVSSDVVIGARDQKIWSWNNFGQLIPGWPKGVGNVVHQTAAMGDLDLDGRSEIVFLSQSQLLVVDVNNAPNSASMVWPMFAHDAQRTGCANCPEDIVTAVEDTPGGGTRLSFAAPAPNPSAGATTFRYLLPVRAQVRLEIYDLRGHRLRTVVREEQPAGPQEMGWDGRDEAGRGVASGTYFARLKVRGPGLDQELTRKIVMLR